MFKRLYIVKVVDNPDSYFIFSRKIDELLEGRLNLLLELFIEFYDNEIYDLSIYEFMFFITAVHSETNFMIYFGKCTDLIKSYRELSELEKRCLISMISGNINTKRAYKMWLKKAYMLFDILNESVYFELLENGNLHAKKIY